MKAIRLFGIYDTPTNKRQAGSVWDINGLCPTLDTMGGGNRQPLVIVKTRGKHNDKQTNSSRHN